MSFILVILISLFSQEFTLTNVFTVGLVFGFMDFVTFSLGRIHQQKELKDANVGNLQTEGERKTRSNN